VDEKDPIVPKLREMLFLKQIIRCVLSCEAAPCWRGQYLVQPSRPADDSKKDVHEQVHRCSWGWGWKKKCQQIGSTVGHGSHSRADYLC
jgi:hypothetical protein